MSCLRFGKTVAILHLITSQRTAWLVFSNMCRNPKEHAKEPRGGCWLCRASTTAPCNTSGVCSFSRVSKLTCSSVRAEASGGRIEAPNPSCGGNRDMSGPDSREPTHSNVAIKPLDPRDSPPGEGPTIDRPVALSPPFKRVLLQPLLFSLSCRLPGERVRRCGCSRADGDDVPIAADTERQRAGTTPCAGINPCTTSHLPSRRVRHGTTAATADEGVMFFCPTSGAAGAADAAQFFVGVSEKSRGRSGTGSCSTTKTFLHDTRPVLVPLSLVLDVEPGVSLCSSCSQLQKNTGHGDHNYRSHGREPPRHGGNMCP